jgi:hypothetical protein
MFRLMFSIFLVMFLIKSAGTALGDDWKDAAGLDLLGGDGKPPKTEKFAYLGITAKSVDDTLRAQLNLPDDVGLTIMTVDRKGPAAGDLQVNDVLQKLDDQLLIDPHQFVTLIHLHRPGDTVTLTVIRQAKPMTVTIKLGEKQKMVVAPGDANHPGFTDLPAPDGFPAPAGFDTTTPMAKGEQVSMSFKDDLYSAFIITDRNGHKTLTVKDTLGNTVATGPADTDEEWGKFSADVRTHLEVMHKMMNLPAK